MRFRIVSKRRLNAKMQWEDASDYFLDDRQVSKAEYDKAAAGLPKPDFSEGHGPDGQADWNREVVSDGLAVVPKRIKDAESYCKKHGVPTDFSTHKGRPIFKSRAHRRKVLRLFSAHDNQGGYLD